MFQAKRYEEERAKDVSQVYSIRLNKSEEALLNSVTPILQQVKLSTLIKQLAFLYAQDVLQDKSKQRLLAVATNNVRRNTETGIPLDMPSDASVLGNVIQNE